MSESILQPSHYPLFDKFFTRPSQAVIDKYGKNGSIQGSVLLYYTDCHMFPPEAERFKVTAKRQKYLLFCETFAGTRKKEDCDFVKFIVKDNEKIFDLFPENLRDDIGEGVITVNYRYDGTTQKLYLEVTDHKNMMQKEGWAMNKKDSSVLDFIGILYSLQDSKEYARMHEDLD